MRLVLTPNGPIEVCKTDAAPGSESLGTIVLLHGIQGTSKAWEKVGEFLGSRRSILTPNLRGRGNSFSPADPAAYSLRGFAADLKAVLTSAEPPLVLVGWSMGVLVALSYLDEYGQSGIGGLILASGTAHPNREAVWFKGRTLSEIEVEAEQRARDLNLAVSARPAAVAGAWASVREADLRHVLPKIRVPTLVVHGSDDDQCPIEHGQAIANGIPGADFLAWEGRGHNLMAEDPRRFAATITNFAEDLSSTNMLAATQ